MSDRARTCLIAVAAAVCTATAGCTSVVQGTASHAPRPAESAGPLTRVLGSVALNDHVGVATIPRDAAAYEDGGSVVLLSTIEDTYGETGFLVDLQPGELGPTVERIRELPWMDEGAEVVTRPDGTVVVAGVADGYIPLVGPAYGYNLIVFDPDDTNPEARPLEPELEDDPDTAVTALSPDGRTLYVAFGWYGDDPGMLAAIDVETGEMRATQPPQLDSPGEVEIYDIAALPDGGFAAMAQVAQDPEGDVEAAFYVEYDADLERTGEPLPLVTDDPESGAYGLHVAADGTAYALVTVQYRTEARIVVVRDGEVTDSVDLEGSFGPPHDFAVDPSGRYVYLPYIDTDDLTTFVTVDLEEAEPEAAAVETVRLCPDTGDFGFVVLDGDAQSVTVTGACIDGQNFSIHSFLVA
jgi:hypothetical protein